MKIQSPKIAQNDGLTLIELVISIFILTIGVISLMTVLVNGEKWNRASQAKAMALNAAEERMEAIFFDAPSNIMLYNGQTFAVGNLQGPGGNPPGLITVTNTQPRQVTITVQWVGSGVLPAGNITLRALRSTAPR
jgi:type II secretory pathway pseudopilin PulG